VFTIIRNPVHGTPKAAFTLGRNTHPDYDHDEPTQFIDLRKDDKRKNAKIFA